MADLSVEVVSALLAQHGLSNPTFEADAVTADLLGALDSAATLDDLVESGHLTDAVLFDPRWPES